ncbi:MAG: hypothetical protein M3Q79_00500 [bacterium]|nr:hypothetical protein [bacterium]
MEKFNFKRASLLAITLATLGGCGIDGEEGTVPASNENGAVPSVQVEYYDNGNRLLSYSNINGQLADIFQTCDGRDLLEQTEFFKYGYGAAGNSISRSVGHSACVDGILTPEDFQLNS